MNWLPDRPWLRVLRHARGGGQSAAVRSGVAAARADLPDGHPVTTAIATGKTVEDAAASLDWEPGDLLYVGSSRLAQPFHLFLGSTAAKMLRVLAVPMIVVPRGA